jgi:hypothetical protein
VSRTFTADENTALIALLVGTIERHPFPKSQQVQRLRSILEKVRPRPKLLLDQEIEQDRFEDLVDE